MHEPASGVYVETLYGDHFTIGFQSFTNGSRLQSEIRRRYTVAVCKEILIMC